MAVQTLTDQDVIPSVQAIACFGWCPASLRVGDAYVSIHGLTYCPSCAVRWYRMCAGDLRSKAAEYEQLAAALLADL